MGTCFWLFLRLNLNTVSISPLSRPNFLIAKLTNFMNVTRKFLPLTPDKIFWECKNVWILYCLIGKYYNVYISCVCISANISVRSQSLFPTLMSMVSRGGCSSSPAFSKFVLHPSHNGKLFALVALWSLSDLEINNFATENFFDEAK